MKAAEVASLSLDLLRRRGPDAVAARLETLPRGALCVVNAASRRDLGVLVAGLVTTERAGRRFLFRTAVDFVAARLGLEPRTIASVSQLPVDARSVGREEATTSGGLIVVGSTFRRLRRMWKGCVQRPRW